MEGDLHDGFELLEILAILLLELKDLFFVVELERVVLLLERFDLLVSLALLGLELSEKLLDLIELRVELLGLLE